MPTLTKLNAVFALLSILIAESCGNPQQAIAVQFSPQERTFRKWDKNGDGVLLRSEVPEGLRRMFGRVDRNQDGNVEVFYKNQDKIPLPAFVIQEIKR